MDFWFNRAISYLVRRAYVKAVTDDACDFINFIRLLYEAIGGKNFAKLVFGTLIKIGAAFGILRLLLMI